MQHRLTRVEISSDKLRCYRGLVMVSVAPAKRLLAAYYKSNYRLERTVTWTAESGVWKDWREA